MCRTSDNQPKLHQYELRSENYVLKKRPASNTITVHYLEEDNSRLQVDNSRLQAKNEELIKQNANLCNEVDRLNSLLQQ